MKLLAGLFALLAFLFMGFILGMRLDLVVNFFNGSSDRFAKLNFISWLAYFVCFAGLGYLGIKGSGGWVGYLIFLIISIIGALISMLASGERLFLSLAPEEFYAFPLTAFIFAIFSVVRIRVGKAWR